VKDMQRDGQTERQEKPAVRSIRMIQPHDNANNKQINKMKHT